MIEASRGAGWLEMRVAFGQRVLFMDRTRIQASWFVVD